MTCPVRVAQSTTGAAPCTRVNRMGFLTRFTQGGLRLTQLEAFSDGVFAIIVTLLVLELKVPALHDPGSVHELAQQLLALLLKFLSWLIKLFICHYNLTSFAA